MLPTNILKCPKDGRHKGLKISVKGYYCLTCEKDVYLVKNGIIKKVEQ